METENSTKYQKLAAEYAKLRAQASVLKRAVLEEQNKSSVLRESVRIKEANLRKSEQEVDSLGFRNKQLERRVATLQENLEQELKKVATKGQKSKTSNDGLSIGSTAAADSMVIAEELQKKILENAQLVTLMDDKNAEIRQFQLRLEGLEKDLQQQASVEQKLRKEMETLTLKNTELESKISEATSTIGSEDGLSVTADMENHFNNHFSSSASSQVTTGAVAGAATNHNNNNNNVAGSNNHNNYDDRIVFLEKELSHWRAQYELLKIESASHQHRTSAALAVDNASMKLELSPPDVVDKNAEDNQTQSEYQAREQQMTECFTKSIGGLFHDKCRAESKLASHLLESQRLQSHLDIVKNRLKECEEAKRNEEHRYRIIEDELGRTRSNYEEQISVLTEQVISLSDQLANCK
ncbi:protein phosphatase 1 regulatory subunit 21 [Sabethes cyaneus]|uniref:protein phosphatase 1 regulatory subunit 21 n=1 Tax=Sabethes cyaneus TaxID=53552 RepID=UPI00237DA383|nr:protein phosphatase 1 regulatory subunit 21 [Sabethes cyaneus]XP_053687736.1 protein phosphatase 1 regulatory subunit 21 [Sabethes cyaneus]